MNKKLLLYVLMCGAAAVANSQKLSPNAQALLDNFDGKKSVMLRTFSDTVATEVKTAKVFLDVDDESVLDSVRMYGGRVFMYKDGLATAELPLHSMREISELGSIRYVDMGGPIHLCMDEVRKMSGIDNVHTNALSELPQSYDGTGVVVGLIDCGLDYRHIDFLTEDGSDTRIKRVWDQNAVGKSPEKFGYGAEYTTFGEMKSAKTDDDSEYHGSHTTGIAAGSDRKSAYYGVAPGADIVYVSFGNNTADIPNAVQYIFDYAESVGKPCVVNMSLGSHMGPHDGTSSLDRYFESVAGPGRILVGSVGNEGESNMHIGKRFATGDTQLKTLLEIPSGCKKNTALDIWGKKDTEFTVQIVITDAKGKVIDKSDAISSSSTTPVVKAFDNNVDCYFKIYPSDNTSSGAPNVYVECYINTVGDTRNIGVILSGSEDGYVNMWNLGGYDFVSGGLRGWTAGDNVCTSGEIGGTGDAVISVGSYNSRFAFPMYALNPDALYVTEAYPPDQIPVGEISFFSSNGPTIDGRMKPDVLAPGALVISAMNGETTSAISYSDQMMGRTLDSDGKGHYYYLNIGTSMSAPVVTGSVALWLQAKPDLTPDEVRDVVKRTSTRDAYTGSEPNSQSGYGKLDVYNGLKQVLALAGVESVGDDASDDGDIWLDWGSRMINVSVNCRTRVAAYSVTGNLVGRYDVDAGVGEIDCSGWVPGVYILRIESTGVAKKIMVR